MADVQRRAPFSTAIALVAVAIWMPAPAGAGDWLETARLTAPPGGPGAPRNLLGTDLALDGDTGIAGGARETTPGSAWILSRVEGSWQIGQELSPDRGVPGDDFGAAVAIEGETAAIGAPGDSESGSHAGAAYVFVFDGTAWNEAQKVVAGDAGPNHRFGRAVALAGDTLVIGAPEHDTAGQTNSGAVYVFERNGAVWSQSQRLEASDASSHQEFGIAVALSGDTLLVGADETSVGTGAYVFERIGGEWQETQKLLNPVPGIRFGEAIALEGSLAVIGGRGYAAPGPTSETPAPAARLDLAAGGRGGDLPGGAFVFERTAGTWTQVQALASEATDVEFGLAVAIGRGGDLLAVGTPGSFDSEASIAVYERDGGTWTEIDRIDGFASSAGVGHQGTLVFDDDERILATDPRDWRAGFRAGAIFVLDHGGAGPWTLADVLWPTVANPQIALGAALGLSGRTLAAGAPRDDGAAGDAGAVFVFAPVDGNGTLVQKLIAGDPEIGASLGEAVALDGDRLAAGAPGHGRSTGLFDGAVYLFERAVGPWQPVQVLTASEPTLGARFGDALALDDDLLAVGAPSAAVGAQGRTGSVEIFERGSDGVWTLRQRLLAADGVDGDAFGRAVALAGGFLAVGAPGHDESGAVYLFVRAGDTFVPVDKVIGSNDHFTDDFGASVALAGDLLLVGAPGVSNTGAAYLFVREGGGWQEEAILFTAFSQGLPAFGSSVAILGSRLLIAAEDGDIHEVGSDAGAVSVFVRDDAGVWQEAERLTASDASKHDHFGTALAVSDNRVAVGAPFHEDDARPMGTVYLFEAPALFFDGFESGSTSAWSDAAP